MLYRGPALLIVAGAGSGKTSVLTRRIAGLIHSREAWPSQILAITFTNKAQAKLCVDVVKIDRSFVRDLGTNADHQALTRTILSLADGFAMTAASTVPAIPQLVVGRPLGGLTYGYSPTSPSIASRMMSAWPRCRAYSSIMCTVTQRSVY